MGLPQSFLCCYINLEASADRRAQLEAQLEIAGVHAERISAFDARQGYRSEDVAYQPSLRRLIGSPLNGGEIGCTESHRRALRRIVESGAEFGVILEDDAVLSPGFKAAVEAVIAETAGWDVVRLEWRKPGILADPGVTISTGQALLVPKNVTYGGTAMLYARRGAQRVLRSLDKGYFQGNDPHLGALCGFGFRFFQISPPVAFERQMESLLGNRPETAGGENRASSRRNRMQLQLFGIYRAWLSIRRRASAGVNAARLKRMSESSSAQRELRHVQTDNQRHQLVGASRAKGGF